MTNARKFFDDDLQVVQQLTSVALPSARQVINGGRELCSHVKLSRSAFLRHVGVDSEYAYKRACANDDTIMYHAHIGLNDCAATVKALRHLDAVAKAGNFTMDRAGLAFDKRMSLPSRQRKDWPAETGPLMESEQDWREVAECAYIQPHMGDFMIGHPASVENAVHALRVGVTTIGNLSQYFSFEAPGWLDRVKTTEETVKAIALLAGFREKGVMLHSYLEDGFGALFKDCTTVAGWAYLEKYIVEDLLGARLSHCIGGLTSDPIKRVGWVAAFSRIHGPDAAGSMIYGDTISFDKDFNSNRGLVSEYLLWDIMAQLRYKTGHAVLPLPVTEAVRIPSVEEIVDAQCLGRRVEKTARHMLKFVDFSEMDKFADTVCRCGREVFNNALYQLKDLGVDVKDPIRMLYVLKSMGAARFERMFGAGECETGEPRARSAVIATDMYKLARRVVSENRDVFLRPENKARVWHKRLLLASTDVHEHAIYALGELLGEAGAEVINLGAEQNPEQVANAALEYSVDGVLLSTHNGNALEYSKRLQRVLHELVCETPVIVGGVLNQKVDSDPLPIPVDKEIAKLGFHVVTGNVKQLTNYLSLPASLVAPDPGRHATAQISEENHQA